MKVAVIGIGAIGPIHINAILSAKQEIVALCDVDAQKCQTAKEKFGLNCNIYTNYVEMLETERLDSVHICTPHYLHAQMICECLDRNVNALCEKPLAINETQLDLIEKSVKKSNAQLGVCFQNRFNASILYIRDYMKGKKITAGSANLIWERNEEYYSQDEWRGTLKQEGGGVMINQAIHGLDVVQWLCGYPESVIAYTSNVSLKGVIDVEDTAFGVFSLKNGGNFVVNATNACKFCFPIYYMFRADNDTVELSANNIIINGKFITKTDGTAIFGKEEWGVGHVHLISEFYRALNNGEKFSVDFYEGRKAVLLLLSMYKSNGEKILIKE